MEFYKDKPDIKYIFIMHDEKTYTEQIGENAFIEHLKVPRIDKSGEYRTLFKKSIIEPLLVKLNPDVIEVGSPYFMPRIVNSVVSKHQLKSKVFGFWHADFPVTYVKRYLQKLGSPIANAGEQIAWAFARKHYNKMEGVLASSEAIIRRMESNGIKNVHFVPLGVDHNLFNKERFNQKLLEELKAGDDDRLTMLFSHRFSNEKGIDLLIDAYPLLCQQLNCEPALVFAGSGPRINRVTNMVEKYRNVHFVGFIEDKVKLAEYYASVDLGFALSEWETFGLSQLEALSSGLPILVANDGAALEHANNSGIPIILKERTPTELAKAIVAFAKSPNPSFKKKAVTYAKKFSWRNCFERQLEIYRSI
ncbi:glycosyltransferase [Ekhidna sp.]|uniref:glycosyltransferase n=1 Tax=Ekhidna sp. TaxID=2608089 RepID=UPI003B51323D